MRIKYEDWTPGPEVRADIRRAEAICRAYAAEGFDLTVRQLYYQFVARGWIPNNMRSYKRLCDIINKARLAGLLDWSYIVDRTRNLVANSHWTDAASIVRSAAESFQLDKWADQPRRVEVWVEKDALSGIVGQVASQHDCAHFACRGYISQSELWAAAQRIGRYIAGGQGVTILHLGDHDPSGLDMTRDIRDRLNQFLDQDWLNAHSSEFPGNRVRVSEIRESMRDAIQYGEPLEVDRIALNWDQVEQYDPPPNPTKLTDSRANGYVAQYGYESWELDALDPTTLATLIAEAIESERNDDLYEVQQAAETQHVDQLTAAYQRWPEVVALLEVR